MENIKIYDFHTHVKDLETIEKYYDDNIIPIINCQSEDEFNKIKKIFNQISYNSNSNEIRPFISAGIHPQDSHIYMNNINGKYEKIISEATLVGEIGMDDYWCKTPINIQKQVFIKSLELAKKYNKAVILHTKGMEKIIYDIIKAYNLIFIVHWYSCEDYIEKFIDKGCYFTIGPAVLIDANIRKLVEKAPIDRLLFETDGIEAMEWLFEKSYYPKDILPSLESVCEEISLIKNLSKEKVLESICENSEKILKI